MDTGPKRVNSMHRLLCLFFFIFAEGSHFLVCQSSAKRHLRMEKTKVVDEEQLYIHTSKRHIGVRS